MTNHSHDLPEEEEEITFESSFLKPKIFEGTALKNIPSGFDAVTIYLDGRMEANLDWKKAREEAHFAIEHGFALFWDIDLGLFEKLSKPLANQAQFLSLALSLEHFRDSLWKDFRSSSIGVSLFRGDADFSHRFAWDLDQEKNFKEWLRDNCGDHSESQESLKSLFCRDVAVEYLTLLASRLPDTLPVYLFLDAGSFKGSLTDEVQSLNPERFERFHLALKNFQLPFEAVGWGKASPLGYSGVLPAEIPSENQVSIGICIPPMLVVSAEVYQSLEKALLSLQQHALPYRLIAESRLTSNWDGLDYLIYCPAGLSKEGRRKLQGFCAAGGTVISTGDRQGFALETDLLTWTKDGQLMDK